MSFIKCSTLKKMFQNTPITVTGTAGEGLFEGLSHAFKFVGHPSPRLSNA